MHICIFCLNNDLIKRKAFFIFISKLDPDALIINKVKQRITTVFFMLKKFEQCAFGGTYCARGQSTFHALFSIFLRMKYSTKILLHNVIRNKSLCLELEI